MFWRKIDLIQTNIYLARRYFVWIKQILFNSNKSFVWFKQRVFEPNKNLFKSNKFLPKSNKLYLRPHTNAIICLFWRKIDLIQTNIYLAQRYFARIKQILKLNSNKSYVWIKKTFQTNYIFPLNQLFFLSEYAIELVTYLLILVAYFYELIIYTFLAEML